MHKNTACLLADGPKGSTTEVLDHQPAACAEPGADDSWDYCPIEQPRLRERAHFYARRAAASPDIIGAMDEMLGSPLGRALLGYSEADLFGLLMNDAYKPKMHKLYDQLYSAVEADFCLNIRRTPFPLRRMFHEDSALAAEYERCMHGLKDVLPITPEVKDVLRRLYDFDTSPEMDEHAKRFRTAPVTWQSLDEGRYVTSASGPVDAASNAETSMTQIVQQFTIRAQARDLQRRTGARLDRTERVANSLGHLAGVLTRLQVLRGTDMKLALFAGRRATDRTFLLLQNVLCARCLPNYGGTSSVFAATLIDRMLRSLRVDDPRQRAAVTGRLVGTHAHELMMITAQLLAAADDEAGGPEGPVAVSALASHLLLLRANGGLYAATALPDTFGTRAFVQAALVAEVPREFVDDMASLHPEGPPIRPHARVFDIFRMWRLDSGSYADTAEAVVAAWERRCADASAQGGPPPPKPGLMHSNLSSVEDILDVSRLPERIRPTVCAFGGLADGFLPFALPGGGSAEIQLASVVMKATQARLVGGAAAAGDGRMECAGKLGDDVSMVKAQVDPRLPREAQERVKQRMAAMLHRERFDGPAISRVLAQAYHDVTRRRILCGGQDL